METRGYILLVDDDPDEHILFEDALRELPQSPSLQYAHGGQQLLELLADENTLLPTIIFLDLNMPRVNGFECLKMIRLSSRFNHVPVVIFSTSSQTQAVDTVYEQGANYYIRKPNTFSLLKEVIARVLEINRTTDNVQPLKENFIINY